DDCVRDRPVPDDAAVDEDVLRAAGRALLGERRDKASQPQAARLLADFDQIGALAVELIEPVAQRRGRRTLENRAAAAREQEARFGVRQCELSDDAGYLRRFGSCGL